MRALVAVVLVVLCAPAAGAATVRSVTAPGPVLALAHDGPFVAYAAGRSAGDCNRVYVWNLATRGVTKLGRRTHCIDTSTGNAISSLAVAGRRVLWLHFAGGNRRNYTIWTATTTRPLPRLLASQEVDVDDSAPFVVGEGDDAVHGSLLPYARGRTVVALHANGSRAFTWTAPSRVVALAAFRGELAIASAGGSVTVLGERARWLRAERYPAEVGVVRLTGNALAVQHGRTLELRGGRTGAWTLPAGARLEDVEGSRALYVVAGRVRVLDLSAGATRDVSRGTAARLDGPRTSIASGRVVTVR